MKPAAIMYLVTRTHGLRTRLITPHDIQFLAKTKSLKEVSDNLLKTEYGAEISKLPTKEVDASTLEEIFLKTLVKRFFFITREAQGRMHELLNGYCTRFVVENIKRIIRAKHGGEIVEEPNLIPLPREYTLVNFPALLNAKDVNEVVGLLRETLYRPLAQKLELYKQAEVTMILEAALDEIYFAKLWEAVGKVSDGEGLKDLIGEEIDLTNLLITFALKVRNLSANLIEQALVSSSHKVPLRRLRSLAKTRLEDAPSILTTPPYSKLASEAVTLVSGGGHLPLEKIFLKQLYEDASKALKTQFLEAGYIIAYLLLCECEARNLITIATGKQLGVDEEKISQSLFAVWTRQYK
jgi:vacuolar-type H+-ATPase subunit C/Vma6